MTSVVLVHGLWMPGAELALLKHRLRRAAFTPLTFRYHSVRDDLDTSASALDDFIAPIDDRAVDLVGHSLGGLVMLKCAEQFGIKRIRRLICLGTPFLGSAAGEHLRAWPGGRYVLGRAMAQALAEAPDRRWDGRRELGVIAGRIGLGLGRLFGRLPVPHDGTVGVAETELPGAVDHIVLPVTHFSMLWSRAVADQVVAFLRRGRFDGR